ncbi:putative Protein NLRC3 [Paratrimastix pyriformis]|uniref:Uncharacterized protein n=1 Tax=Paratrimastix pyriformis TaxID=342808 RepID=A0ABQ8UKL5_9EUKA|nr:putative Protein NLRC3 [Paratrimastix pyriformis]
MPAPAVNPENNTAKKRVFSGCRPEVAGHPWRRSARGCSENVPDMQRFELVGLVSPTYTNPIRCPGPVVVVHFRQLKEPVMSFIVYRVLEDFEGRRGDLEEAAQDSVVVSGLSEVGPPIDNDTRYFVALLGRQPSAEPPSVGYIPKSLLKTVDEPEASRLLQEFHAFEAAYERGLLTSQADFCASGEFDLSKRGIRGAAALAGWLGANHTVRKLTLTHNRIGVDGARAIAAALEQNDTLHTLDLSENPIGPEGLCALLSLRHNTALHTLHLGDYLCDDGARALAGALARNQTLHELALGRDLTDAGAQAIAVALEQNRALEKLVLDGNNRLAPPVELGAAGICALLEMRHNTALHHLSLASLHLGPAEARAIAGALERNHSILTLDLGGNDLLSEGLVALADSLAANRSLRTVRQSPPHSVA